MSESWRELTPAEYAALFPDLLRYSAFRLEQLDYYVSELEEEPFAQYQAGAVIGTSWLDEWTRFIREATGAGATISRVHVVSEPWSPYVDFELNCIYPVTAAAGEDIRVASRGTSRFLGHDFWLVDDTAARMNYDPDGNWTSVSLTSSPAIVTRYRSWRGSAIAASQPLQSYLALDHRRTA